MADLKDKIFIVTGASSGIGLATCNKLLAAGAKVFGTDVAQEPESLSNHKQGGTFAFHQGNLTKPSVPEDVVAAALSTFKSEHIDGLLNVAGIIDAYQAADTVDDDTWDRVIAVNLTAPLKMTRAAIPAIRKSGKGGVILNVASKAGMSGGASGIAYTSSKHGLIGQTRHNAWRYKDEKIRCNAIAPGGVATNIAQGLQREKMDMASFMRCKAVTDLVINQETGEGVVSPELAAGVLTFLCSDAASGINGAILPVDQGWSVI